jgi:tetratricopeptide (TPR) repeat protein
MSDHITDELSRLFEFTKKSDEFEFINVLIGFSGMGDQRALTHLHESREYIKDMVVRYQAEDNIFSRTRLGLHIYCHIFEMDELYNIIGNLLRISSNQKLRYIPNLYSRNEVLLTPTDKIDRIGDIAPQSHFEYLTELIQELYRNNLRNSFVHSAYSLLNDDYHIVRGKGVKIGNKEYHTLKIKEYILPLVDNTIVFIESFFNIINEHKLSYKANRVIEARMPEPQPVMVLGDPNTGLIGFQTFVGSWVKFNSQYGSEYFIEAMNIRFNTSDSKYSDLEKELIPYSESLTPYGKTFDNIRDKAIESGNPDLIRMLAIIYYNAANNKVNTADGKPERQFDAILQSALQQYNLSIETDPSFDRSYLNKASTIMKLNMAKGTVTTELRQEVLYLYDKAIKTNGQSFEAWGNSAQLLQEIGNEEQDPSRQLEHFTESIKRNLHAISLYPHTTFTYTNLAWVKTRLGHLNIDRLQNFRDAVRYYEIAVEKNTNLKNELALASALEDLANTVDQEEALVLLNRSIEMLRHTADKYGKNSDIYYRLGNKHYAIAKLQNDTALYKNAIECFEKSIELHSGNINAINNLSRCQLILFVNEEKKQDSHLILPVIKERLLEVLNIQPNDTSATINLVYVTIELAKCSPYEDRQILLQQAITKMTQLQAINDESYSFDMARAYALSGDKLKSLHYLKLWVSEGNQWGEQGFTDDFEILSDEVEFKNITSK